VTGGDRPSFGDFVRRRREELGLSQAALARKVDLGLDSVGRLERNERRAPALAQLRIWAEALEVDEDLLRDLRAPPPEPVEAPAGGEPARVWPELPALVDQLLARSSREIVIWQSWLPTDIRFRESMAAALARGSAPRILVTDPAVPALIERAAGMGLHRPADYLAANLAGVLAQLGSIPGVAPEAVVRLADALPMAPLYATEESIVMGWYFPGRPSTVQPHVEASARSALAVAVLAAFEDAWAVSRPLP
jgi:transcriptional regulator with XRE-family HTH domain